jgi:hypothetical protein
LRMSIFPLNSLRGVRSADVVCAEAVTPSVMAIAEVMTTRETRRLLEALQIIL